MRTGTAETGRSSAACSRAATSPPTTSTAGQAFEANDIGDVLLHLDARSPLDLYRDSRYTGSLILVDAETNRTVAGGMVQGELG